MPHTFGRPSSWGKFAMTVVLLCGAGLLVRTVVGMNRADSGFDKQNLLTMNVAVPGARYADEQGMAFYRRAVAALRMLPGVSSATAASSLPVIGSPPARAEFHVRGTAELSASERPTAVIRVVMPGYFGTLRIPVLRGREFTDADDASPALRVVVNEAFAKAFLSGATRSRCCSLYGCASSRTRPSSASSATSEKGRSKTADNPRCST
jgi:putative ABC transport system permease protein